MHIEPIRDPPCNRPFRCFQHLRGGLTARGELQASAPGIDAQSLHTTSASLFVGLPCRANTCCHSAVWQMAQASGRWRRRLADCAGGVDFAGRAVTVPERGRAKGHVGGGRTWQAGATRSAQPCAHPGRRAGSSLALGGKGCSNRPARRSQGRCQAGGGAATRERLDGTTIFAHPRGSDRAAGHRAVTRGRLRSVAYTCMNETVGGRRGAARVAGTREYILAGFCSSACRSTSLWGKAEGN